MPESTGSSSGATSRPRCAASSSGRAALWNVVDAVGPLLSSELWSWSYHDGHYQVQPFEAAGVRDESDAAQLWSAAFLALRPSAPH